MITIISGTNREGSNTKKIAENYQRILNGKGVKNELFDMAELPQNLLSPKMYSEKSEAWLALQEKYLIAAEKFLFVFPEYNGAFPGVLKMMIDVTDIKPVWHGKKASLTGVSTGRAGCARGIDAMTNMLHYIKTHVLPNKLPISQVHTLLNEAGELNSETIALMEQQVDELIAF